MNEALKKLIRSHSVSTIGGDFGLGIRNFNLNGTGGEKDSDVLIPPRKELGIGWECLKDEVVENAGMLIVPISFKGLDLRGATFMTGERYLRPEDSVSYVYARLGNKLILILATFEPDIIQFQVLLKSRSLPIFPDEDIIPQLQGPYNRRRMNVLEVKPTSLTIGYNLNFKAQIF